jgi:hypothetical protein
MSNKPYATELQAEVDKTMDWLCELPEAQMRQVLPDLRIPQNVDFKWTIGGTEYTVRSQFQTDKGGDFIHKIKRLLESEVSGS